MRKLKESTSKEKKLRASKNKAKDVETPKIKPKRIDIPKGAKIEIARLEAKLQNYIADIAAGLDIKGSWSFDMQRNQIIVEDR